MNPPISTPPGGLKDTGLLSRDPDTPSGSYLKPTNLTSLLRKLLSYPSPGSLKLYPTSWLDGLRGIAALEVYLFHALGCWATLVPAWHSSPDQTYIFQLPLLRTLFVSGPCAVSLFFSISGYVLTQKSLRWIRDGETTKMYGSVRSSMMRRGVRLYLPPVALTFVEMCASRFGVPMPLNFDFRPESTFAGQVWDWISQTNKWVNPFMHLRYGLWRNGYEAVIWTIPLEFYGSFVCYILLLILSRVRKNRLRMGLLGVFAGVCLIGGAWHLFCFTVGMVIADFHLSQEDEKEKMGKSLPSNSEKTPGNEKEKRWHTLLWIGVFVVAFYVAGLPALWSDKAYEQPMPGYETLVSLTPKVFSMETEAASRFWWSLSGPSLLLSISQLPSLKAFFETNFAQYLGKISFCLYLIHNFCVVLFGIAIKNFLMGIVGLDPNMKEGGLVYWVMCAVWFGIFTTVVFALAAVAERWVDRPNVRFSKWLEGYCSRYMQKSVGARRESNGGPRD